MFLSNTSEDFFLDKKDTVSMIWGLSLIDLRLEQTTYIFYTWQNDYKLLVFISIVISAAI